MAKKVKDKAVLMEDEWQAKSDARTLAEYNEIIKDKPRLERALKEAERQVDNLTERATALNKTINSLKGKK